MWISVWRSVRVSRVRPPQLLFLFLRNAQMYVANRTFVFPRRKKNTVPARGLPFTREEVASRGQFFGRRRDLRLSFESDQNIDNAFSGKPGNCGAAEMLYARLFPEAFSEDLLLTGEYIPELGPVGVNQFLHLSIKVSRRTSRTKAVGSFPMDEA